MPELWRNVHKFTDGSLMWTHSKAQKDKHDNLKYPDDRAAGVGIGILLLSERVCSKVLSLSHGSPCERIIW